MGDSQGILSSEQVVHSNSVNDEFNPQQTLSNIHQVLNPDIFDSEVPYPTYPAHGNGLGSTSGSPRDVLNNRRPPGPTSAIDEDIRKLAASMTPRELAGQMSQIQIGMLLDSNGELDTAKVRYWVEEWGVGSFLDTPSKLDSVHGANYVDGAVLFPQQIGLAATFNITHAYEAGRVTAKDTRAAGIPWVFAPILDVAVHKLWPRVYETFGEDPYLVSSMGSALIKGLQGNYKTDRTRVAACMKHFIGYSASRNGQDKSSAWIPDNILMDYFVPSFDAAVKAGVATAMETYIDINGQPVVGSHFYLTELLRNRLGFKGMLVTDWQELDRLYTEHRCVPSLKDAALQCLKQTSVDMVMVPESESFSKNAMLLVEERKLTRDRLVESAEKILQLKKDLGLFQQPMSDPGLLRLVGSAQDVEAAKEAIRDSITVLKNKDDLLPLLKNSKRILVTGPAANSIRALSGGWSIKWQGAETDDWYQGRGETILSGLEKEFGKENVVFVDTVDFGGNRNPDTWNIGYEIIHADTVVLCLGEMPYAEIVGNIPDLDLPPEQLNLIRHVAEYVKGTDTKIVLVLVEGRPRGLQDLADKVDAIIMAYLPGPWGGHPIAEILSGAVNPSGRLPMTYPSRSSDMVTNYYRVGVDTYMPLFPFGAGLSYSSIKYSDVTLSSKVLHLRTGSRAGQKSDDDSQDHNNDEEAQQGFNDNGQDEGQDDDLDVDVIDMPTVQSKEAVTHQSESEDKAPFIFARVRVQNNSNRPVKETVFWYITQDYRSDIMPEAFLLKGFQKIQLDAEESQDVQFKITEALLAYHGRDLRKKVETGSFTLTVNAMRPEAQSVKFVVE
ncbi:hypothetical protein EDD11_002391 [Mortierella claussenii]|nr:hypothetical protein EDD11_002391 [Mortierella claussenii]